MNEMKSPTTKTGLILGDSGENLSKSSVVRKLKKNTKTYRVLQALTRRSLNLVEAERELADRSLHSTVSSIQAKGVAVARKPDSFKNRMGTVTNCKRYWIEADQLERVKALGVVV